MRFDAAEMCGVERSFVSDHVLMLGGFTKHQDDHGITFVSFECQIRPPLSEHDSNVMATSVCRWSPRPIVNLVSEGERIMQSHDHSTWRASRAGARSRRGRREMSESDTAYGLWPLVAINSAVFIFFAASFFKPRPPRDWRTLGSAAIRTSAPCISVEALFEYRVR